jgi:hypothetical protein
MEEDKSLKKNDKSEDTDDDDDHDSSQIEIGSTIKSDKQESTDDEQENFLWELLQVSSILLSQIGLFF